MSKYWGNEFNLRHKNRGRRGRVTNVSVSNTIDWGSNPSKNR